MSQIFTGIPIGKGKAVFIDIMFIMFLAFALVISLNIYLIFIGVGLMLIVALNPIVMSAFMPTFPIKIMEID